MNLLDQFVDMMGRWANEIVNFLPLSPFHDYLVAFRDLPWLGYINWVVPVGAFIKIGSSWLVAIGIYYVYSAVLRWIGAID